MKDYRTLYRGLRTLFWVEIVGMIGTFAVAIATVAMVVAEVMQDPYFRNSLKQPELSMPNMLPVILWSGVLVLAIAVTHFLLGKAEKRYTVTGVLMLLSVILTGVCSSVEAGYLMSLTPEIITLLSLPLAGLSLAQFCMEIGAHRHALAGVDDKLAKRWRVLRILFLLAIPAVALSALLMALGALLENPMLLFTAIPLVFLIPGGVIALSVLRYVYLYKTGTRFKRMIDQQETEESTDEERTDIHRTREND